MIVKFLDKLGNLVKSITSIDKLVSNMVFTQSRFIDMGYGY